MLNEIYLDANYCFDFRSCLCLQKFYDTGLIRIPIGGSYWLFLWRNYKYVHLAMAYYAKKLNSKLYSCYMGDYFVVIANDYTNVKEILSREEFDGRVTDADYIKDRAFKKKLGNARHSCLFIRLFPDKLRYFLHKENLLFFYCLFFSIYRKHLTFTRQIDRTVDN